MSKNSPLYANLAKMEDAQALGACGAIRPGIAMKGRLE